MGLKKKEEREHCSKIELVQKGQTTRKYESDLGEGEKSARTRILGIHTVISRQTTCTGSLMRGGSGREGVAGGEAAPVLAMATTVAALLFQQYSQPCEVVDVR